EVAAVLDRRRRAEPRGAVAAAHRLGAQPERDLHLDRAPARAGQPDHARIVAPGAARGKFRRATLSSMGDTRDVDPKAATLAAVSRAAGDAAHTLTGPAAVRATASETMVGRQFAHFRVDKPLGAGGMGEVYLATDLALDRPGALKLLPRAFAADPASRERFIREARAQARLNHPNICHIYFIGEQDEQLFFAMEFVEGESLQQILDRQKRIPLVDAVEYARMAALGLREA